MPILISFGQAHLFRKIDIEVLLVAAILPDNLDGHYLDYQCHPKKTVCPKIIHLKTQNHSGMVIIGEYGCTSPDGPILTSKDEV